jgi:hypothetical protein
MDADFVRVGIHSAKELEEIGGSAKTADIQI